MAHEKKLGAPLGGRERDALGRLVRERGEYEVVRDFEIGRATLARALAGLGLRRGTLALIRERLRRCSSAVEGAKQ